MRRTFSPSLALLAGLVTLLSGCAGESPTSSSNPPGGGSGGGTNCNVTIDLRSSSAGSLAGTAVVIRAVVTKNGAPVPDGQSVAFTTDFGFFVETGFPTASKVINGGVADITLASNYAGVSHVKATFECGSATTAVTFSNVPDQGAFVSSVVPQSGSCAGNEQVVFNGGRFTLNSNTATSTRVTFAGLPATIISLTDTAITVLTPTKQLANPQVPETVDVSITLNVGNAFSQTIPIPKTDPRAFTYFCVDKRIFISSLTPTSGPPDGGTTVTINGGNFGANVATTRVTFGGVAAQVLSVADSVITVTTPRHPLASPTVPETVDVAVTKDLGLVSQQQYVLPQAFTYRANSTTGTCPPAAGLFISSISVVTSQVPQPPPGSLPAGDIIGGDVATIRGAGFGTSLSGVRVTFGGIPGQVTAVSDTTITVSTPRYSLANPVLPETVDVVVTRDVGGPNCASATSANAFTFVSTPIISDLSPRTGPNDVSTRITIFGTGFQFPAHVLFSVGPTGTPFEAQVVSVTSTQIIVLSPIAANGNVALANQLATVTVRNPVTNQQSQFTGFKYYACPTVSVATPSYGAYNQTTSVTINGQNFAEPVEAEFVPTGAADAGPVRLNVSSVSASAIIVQVPPIDPQQAATGGALCSNLVGTINLKFPALTCAGPFSVPFTYKIDPPQVTNASPTVVAQDGCTTYGCPIGSQQVITVAGAFFSDPMTVVLLKDGAPLTYTQVNNPVVSNPATLTFRAPAIRDTDMNTQACATGGGVTGTAFVNTSFGIRVTNARTGCSADLPNILIYVPHDPACRSVATITAPTNLVGATLCVGYSQTITGSGGTTPYTWTASGLPPGLSIAPSGPSTALISGTPTLPVTGPGQNTTTYTVTITPTDASATAGSPRTYSLVVTDPGAPFTVTTASPSAYHVAGTGTGASITASPVVGSSGTINWTMTGAPAGMALSTATGTSTQIQTTAVANGTYPVTVTATDSWCGGGTQHTNSLAITVIVP